MGGSSVGAGRWCGSIVELGDYGVLLVSWTRRRRPQSDQFLKERQFPEKRFVIHLYAYILKPHNQIYIYAHLCTLLGSDILTFNCLTINKQTLLKTKAYTPLHTFYIYTHIFMNTKLSASLYTTMGNYQVYNHMAPLTWLAPTNIPKETTSMPSSMCSTRIFHTLFTYSCHISVPLAY